MVEIPEEIANINVPHILINNPSAQLIQSRGIPMGPIDITENSTTW